MRKRESLQVGVAVVLVLAATLACRPRRGPGDAGVSVTPPPTTEATATATDTTTTTAAGDKSTYAVGDKITVRWQGATYPSTVLAVLPNDKYKIHYTGWASSWDETVGLDRIVGAKGAPTATATATAKPKATGGGGGGVAADAPCPGPGITRRCGGVCVNLQEDDRNCGSCGTVCSGGKHCDGHLFCRDSAGNL